MNATGWLALAGALSVLALPPPGTVRMGELAGRGRLGGSADARSGEQPGLGSAVGAGGAAGRPWSWVAAGLAGPAVGFAALRAGPLIAIAVAALCATGGLLGRDVLRRRAATALDDDMATALRVLVGELEAGSQSATALAAAAQAGPEVAGPFTAAAAVARQGGDAGASLAGAKLPGFVAIGSAWRLGDTTGAALADVLGRVAADLASRNDQRRTVSTVLAGPRSSAVLLSALPALGIALGASMGARPVPFLLEAPAGRVLCCIGVLLDVAGILWMRRIVRRAESR